MPPSPVAPWVILHAFVTPGDVSESQVLLDQLRRTLFRRTLRPQRLIADARYGTGPNVHAIENLGIRAKPRNVIPSI